MRLFISAWILLPSAVGWAAAGASLPDPSTLLAPGEHCVAYKTKKRLVLVRTVDVVGKSCKVSAQVIPDLGDTYYFEMMTPIDSLQSGESERDRDVVRILSDGGQRDLVFRSDKMAGSSWRELLNKGERFRLKGILQVHGQEYPVEAIVHIVKSSSGVEVEGRVITEFKALGIDPPSLVVGLMAKVKSELELHFRFQASKTLGASSLLPQESL